MKNALHIKELNIIISHLESQGNASGEILAKMEVKLI